VATDQRLAQIFRDRRVEMIDRLTADVGVLYAPQLRARPEGEAALRQGLESFLDALTDAFARGRTWEAFYAECGVKMAQQGRAYDEVFRSVITVKNGLLPFIFGATPPVAPLVQRLTDVLFQLAQEIDRRYYEIEKRQAEQLAELDTLKSTFLRLTSHELRRPLSVFRGYVSMIESGDLGTVPPAVQKVILEIAVKADEMNKLIDDLSEIARLEEPGQVLRRERCAVEALVHESVEAVRAEALAKQIRIVERLEAPRPTLEVDVARVKVAILNLLSNAIKYSPRNSSVEVLVQRDDANVAIAVRDEGVGIPPEETAKVFDKYYRLVRPETEHIAGTGLGLYIVKQIVEMHGGRVDLTSDVGRGSTFTLILPAA
jgi:signal transduction histidine kinase